MLEGIEAKKAVAPEKLAELWTVDPKRAKRLLSLFTSIREFIIYVWIMVFFSFGGIVTVKFCMFDRTICVFGYFVGNV